MTEIHSHKLIMLEDDHKALISYLRENPSLKASLINDSLLGNIERAELVNADHFPWNVIRLNTRAVIRDRDSRYNLSYTVVLPEEADHRKCKVSVFSPIGAALFGRRRGDDGYWKTPNGKRFFTIMAVWDSWKAPTWLSPGGR